MKKLATIVVMLCSVLAWGGVAPNPTDYNLNVHVSSARISGRGLVRLKVSIAGKIYLLDGIDAENSLLAPGDYKAKTLPVKVKDVHPYDVYGTYEFLFPDGKTRRYYLTGITE